jgi:hypothetical protein
MRTLIVFAALPLVACGGATADGPSPHEDAGVDARIVTPDAGGSSSDAGTLLLEAFGGASGEVAAQVPLLEPDVGPLRTCATPVHAGGCQLNPFTGGIMTFRGGNGTSVPTFDIPATIPGLAVITSPVPTTDGGSAVVDTSQDLSVTGCRSRSGRSTSSSTGGAPSPVLDSWCRSRAPSEEPTDPAWCLTRSFPR